MTTFKINDKVIIVGHEGLNGTCGKITRIYPDGSIIVKEHIGGGRSSTTLHEIRHSTEKERQDVIEMNKELHKMLDEVET